MWTPTIRYPDPAIEVIDPSFARYRVFSAGVERLVSAALVQLCGSTSGARGVWGGIQDAGNLRRGVRSAVRIRSVTRGAS